MRFPVDLRDEVITAFRGRVCEAEDFVPFPHQADWWLAGDGKVLHADETPDGFAVRLPDWSVAHRRVTDRPFGRARVLADLGAFKIGKSKSAAMWACGFAAIPDGKVSLVGLEYDICEPEFNYIVEALLSEHNGHAPFFPKADSLQNRPRDGKMWLDLPNGFRLEAKSWERKDTLKGKEVDAYIFCEAYMLPGIICYDGVKQNLAARKGYALFPTTPDRPWLEDIHIRAHGANADFLDWHCTCGVSRECNAVTFDQHEKDQADPTKGGLMTPERFAIAYLGRLGDYVGRVYNYQRGQCTIPATSPLFDGKPPEMGNLKVPDGWEVQGAIDTGTFMGALIVAFDPDGDAYVLYEQPNYMYVSGTPVLDDRSSIPQWAEQLRAIGHVFGVRGWWADRNSQYKSELRNNHEVVMLPASTNVQTRTEITREYFQQGKLHLAPWLRILPFELENARWPEEATAAGKFERMKVNDHVQDCLEHILARRPRGQVSTPKVYGTWAESVGHPRKAKGSLNPHLGVQ